MPLTLKFILALLHLDTLALRALVWWERLGAHPEVEVPRPCRCVYCGGGLPGNGQCNESGGPCHGPPRRPYKLPDDERPTGEMAVTLDADEEVTVANVTHLVVTFGLRPLCDITAEESIRRNDTWTMDRGLFGRTKRRCEECGRRLSPEVEA